MHDLSEMINRVSRRSLDGSVVMSSEEWNGIVELVEKLLAATQSENDALREQLKRQAKAAMMGMDAAKQAGESMYRHGEKMLSESNPEALESERSANALLTEENEALRERLENYEALKRMHRLDNYPNELSAKAWLLRKQAEAVEAATNEHEIKSATDDSKCYSVALLGYAKRLRQQADEIEND